MCNPTDFPLLEPLYFIDPVARSRRLNLTESCELQIRDVREYDAGVYVCDQLDQSESGSEVDQSQRSESFLSVVSFPQDSSRMTCDVSPYNERRNCGYTVKWLVQGSDRNQLKFRTSECLAEVTYSENSSLPSLSCEVTDLNHNQVFVLQSPGSQWNQTESGPEEPHDSVPVATLLMLVMRSVELLMVSVVMVILLRVLSRCSSADNH
ncbi:uncharacterized protein [Eucyclogobius newberryi]|uniref:uncharacterized protein n=1 Tax=Eucyclogobius newberryi TaxID=166745 RepID=UPI003B5BC0B4